MSPINKEDFLASLQKSNVVAPEKIQMWLEKNPTQDGQETALGLSRSGLITRWQAKYLMSGRHLLKIGNYVLLERLQQDELGDLFVANHETLDRKVQLQFLPTDLKEGSPRCERFLQRVGTASELDHPNLVHIYDVDQEKNRYYLVTEYFTGKPFHEQIQEWNASQLAQLLIQVIDGVQFAHQHNVFHGGINEQNILVSTEHDVKLSGLTLTPLQTDIWDGGSAEADFQQLGEVATNAFRKLPRTDQTGRLESIIASIGSDFSEPTEVRQSLSSYLNHANQVQPANMITEAIEIASTDDGLGQSTVSVKVGETKRDSTQESGKTPATADFNKGPIILASVIVGAIAILGATLYLAFSLSGGSKADPVPVAKQGTSRRAMQKPEKLLADQLTLDPSLSMEEQIQSLPPPPPPPPPTTPPPPPPPTPPPTPPATPPAGQAGQGGGSTKPPKQAAGNPFKNFPAQIDLPLNTEQEPKSLGKIRPVAGNRMSLTLLTGPEISKAKVFFELKANHSDTARQWDILYRKRQPEEGSLVAKFFKNGNDFGFQWLPAAAEDKNVNYLRNCVIKFDFGTHKTQRVLRSTTIIKGFKFGVDNPQIRLEPEMQWLPNPANITTQLSTLSEKEFGRTVVENPVITKKQPAGIFFSDIDYEQLTFILVTADVKSKVKLSASLQLRMLAGQRPKLAKPSLLESAAESLIQRSRNMRLAANQFKATPIDQLRKQPAYRNISYPQKLELEKKLKAEADVAAEQATKFIEQKTSSLEKFYGKVMPLTISYKLGNQNIPLATTISPQ